MIALLVFLFLLTAVVAGMIWEWRHDGGEW